MLRWTCHLEGGPKRVNHAAVVVSEKIYSFGGYCTGEDYTNRTAIDIHVLDTSKFFSRFTLVLSQSLLCLTLEYDTQKVEHLSIKW